MELQSLIYLFVGISFTIYFGIAMWTKSTSTKDFYIVKKANNKTISNGLSIAVDFISAATFISFAGIFLYSYSLTNYIIVGIISGFFILIFIIAPKIREKNELSIPSFFDIKYSSLEIKKLSAFIILAISFLYLCAQIKATGIIFSRIFQIEFTLALLFASILTFFYATIFGKKEFSYSYILQYIIILFSFATPIIFLTISLTNSFIPQLAIFSSIQNTENLIVEIQNSFNISLKESSFLTTTFLTISLALGVATLPHILTKFFHTSSVENSKKSAIWATVFIALIYSFLISLPALSYINFSKNISNVEYKSFINDEFINDENEQIYGKWLKTWQDTNLVKYSDENSDNLVTLNELKIDPDTIFLLNSEVNNMPNWVIALVISGALAATLSTITGLLLLIKATLVNEFLPNNKKISKLKLNSILAILIVFATLFQINNSYTILQIVLLAFTISAATLFPTIILTIFKNIDKKSIFFALLISFLFVVIYTIVYNFKIEQSNYFLYLIPESIGIVGAFLNFFIAIIASKFIFSKNKKSKEIR
ncbi:VC_2705 family sodium/solute symporter [Aliarcobacter skirrowii]|uniref:Cation acetate symporter n=1 Tax=Aliarcobacter skirrowii TaxID=28200 RepID=A0A2U2C210_9BACT|nr:VC_2705 family sodium/solute symporter [Aliarcobacter skirrowii]PWE21351.1 cation acetate symporter [Aliarcobacter skirrowii]PWE22357.1 cation acetate symporter [Aliarcobacter skirrowii]PWE25923.1 cation acetate symporter [Aliarcobacter skirrowii]RJO56065.1 cation acetate symporter [Aliarcobacter skirrowii]RJO57937.1 cation acetate symporter [Aliarcobacter skirrowii]